MSTTSKPCEIPPDVVAGIKALSVAGVSLKDIANTLNTAGVPSVRGCRWHAKTVGMVLSRTQDSTAASNKRKARTQHWLSAALQRSSPPEIRAAAMQKIESAMRVARGQVTVASRILGCDTNSLYRWMQKAPELKTVLERHRDATYE